AREVGASARAGVRSAKRGAATSIVSVAFEALALSLAELDLPASAPRPEQDVAGIAGVGLGLAALDAEKGCRQGGGSQKPRRYVANHWCHGDSLIGKLRQRTGRI